MSKKPTLRLRLDGVWIWLVDWMLFGIYILLLVRGCWDYGVGNLVQRKKIIGINLSQAHIVWYECGRSELHGIKIQQKIAALHAAFLQ